MPKKPSSTVEDYLQAIYNMGREGRVVIGARLSEKLGVAGPTVWATLQRMHRDGLVVLDERKEISLTPAGLEAAASIMRRHRLTERLLTDILGLEWAEAHEEAHRIEHAISPRVEQRIRALLDDPKTCPHGNPIPGSDRLPETSPATYPLTRATPGEDLVVDGISEEAEDDPDLMRFLQRNGLVPGARLRLVEVQPFNEALVVECGGRQVTLGLSAASHVRILERAPAVTG